MNVKLLNKFIIAIFVMAIMILQPHIDYAEGLGDVVTGGDSFISAADEGKIDNNKLKNASDTIYNVLLSLGIIVAVIYGTILGIQFMIASAENKAQVKESMIPFIFGCIVVFGSFAIWKAIMLVLK